jgi:NADP-dependent 3-hydroxy acid dehydrogenase YdfG
VPRGGDAGAPRARSCYKPRVSKLAVVTGASSGIGAASVRALRAAGFDVIAGARRTDRLEALAKETGCTWRALDVTSQESVDEFCAPIETLNLLVNNAGGARGLDPVAHANDDDWRWMFEVNVLGLARTTRALLPALVRSGDGHVLNIGSIAGIEAYEGGAGYTGAKHAVRAITETLRLELHGAPVRVSEILPGMVDGAEFSVRRFGGDEARAAKVYANTTPLTVEDVAECVAFVATRPSHVNVDALVVKPRDQANARQVHRRE